MPYRFLLRALLSDQAYRTHILTRTQNPAVLDFFHNTFDRWQNAFREEAISPVLNKVRAFTTDPLLRAVIGQTRSSFDFREAMDERKIILCDLSKGAIGADNAMLLGSLIVMQEKLATLSRGDIPGIRAGATSLVRRRSAELHRRFRIHTCGDQEI